MSKKNKIKKSMNGGKKMEKEPRPCELVLEING
jgi:hypothetical protein